MLDNRYSPDHGSIIQFPFHDVSIVKCFKHSVMSKDSGDGWKQKKKELDELRDRIHSSNPANDKIPESIKQLAPSRDARKIKYFLQVRCFEYLMLFS